MTNKIRKLLALAKRERSDREFRFWCRHQHLGYAPSTGYPKDASQVEIESVLRCFSFPTMSGEDKPTYGRTA